MLLQKVRELSKNSAIYGVHLLTSIGLNMTSRTRYYPVSTAVGAAVNLGLNFALIPRVGMPDPEKRP